MCQDYQATGITNLMILISMDCPYCDEEDVGNMAACPNCDNEIEHDKVAERIEDQFGYNIHEETE